jgi:THO complex subunit 2
VTRAGRVATSLAVFPELARCTSLDQFGGLPMEMLLTLGPFLGEDALLMTKVLRITVAAFHSHDLSVSAVSDVCRRCFLPGLTLARGNSALAHETWQLVSLLAYPARYALYGAWKTSLPTLHPALKLAELRSTAAVRFVLQRISKDNVSKYGRTFGRISHTSPYMLFQNILSKVQMYENFIQPLVDSLKYVSPLGLDVLVFCLLEGLSSQEKARIRVRLCQIIILNIFC